MLYFVRLWQYIRSDFGPLGCCVKSLLKKVSFVAVLCLLLAGFRLSVYGSEAHVGLAYSIKEVPTKQSAVSSQPPLWRSAAQRPGLLSFALNEIQKPFINTEQSLWVLFSGIFLSFCVFILGRSRCLDGSRMCHLQYRYIHTR